MTTLQALKDKVGVSDWDLKFRVMRHLLNAGTYVELAEKVFPPDEYGEFGMTLADSMRRFALHRSTKPDGPKLFWDRVLVELDCDDGCVTGIMLMDADIDQFIEYLPNDRQARARELVADARLENGQSRKPISEVLPEIVRDLGRGDLNVMFLRHDEPVETIATGLHAGKIDQKHYYLDPDSANSWGRLVRAEAYPTYDHCRRGLQALFGSEPWNQQVKSHPIGAAVMLAGGGAPTKDLLLMRTLLAQPGLPKSLDYYLLDISFYLLNDSRLWIQEHLPTLEGFEKVNLALVWQDALRLRRRDRDLFHKNDGRVVFAITGGTIGNFSEATFFHSLDRAAEIDDLLVISADTIDNVPSGDVEATLTHKYDNRDLRRFIEPVVQKALSESRAQESLSSALKRIRVQLRPGRESNASDVPSSYSVNVTLDIKGREVSLVTSTRYLSSALLDFAAGFGWNAVCQIDSPLNAHFKQFLFRRNKSESSGIRLVP
jgi:hypothetical protein